MPNVPKAQPWAKRRAPSPSWKPTPEDIFRNLPTIRRAIGRAVRRSRRLDRDRRAPFVPSAEDRYEAREALALLRASMTPERWRALLAAEDDGLTAREIAEAEGVPVTTIEWWLREARTALARASCFT